MAPPGAATASPPPRNGAPVEAPPAPDHLIEWLMHTTPDTRIAAARELGRGGDRRAVEPLIQALSDIHPPVRIAVANALGKLRDERAIDALATVLAEDEEIVRTAARGALEAIGTTLANAVLAEDDRRVSRRGQRR
jgi:HEAT repeat protein